MRIGLGYDIHRLVEGRNMILGGVSMPEEKKGLKGHSDGDVLLHAVCDALLGAIGEDDLGTRYPDNAPAYKDADSSIFLKDAAETIRKKGFKVKNIDCVVIAEKPKIAPIRADIAESIEKLLDVPSGTVNVKGKTNEGLGETGEGKAIAAQAVVLLEEI